MATEQNIILKRWMITGAISLIVVVFSWAMWVAKIQTSIHNIEKDLIDIKYKIDIRTVDRYYKQDAERDWKFHREREHRGSEGEVPHSHTRTSP